MSFTDYWYYLAVAVLLLATLFIRLDRRWILLLIFSAVFYGWGRWSYLWLLLFSIFIDYVCALGIHRSSRTFWRCGLLTLSLVSNLGLLLFFKYFTALYDDWSWIQASTGVLNIQFEKMLLPLGISFYTLQSMGYTIDVYRRELDPERHFGYFSLYVCFFPQLVAGPIERPRNLLPQLKTPSPIRIEDLQAGLFLIGMGLLKKLLISNRLFMLLQDQLTAPDQVAGWQAASFGTVVFFAVYLDIAAYTDIARGSARLFGIHLMKNFNRPMFALSMGDFWKRWHISLSSWMMNYLFRSIAGLSQSRAFRHGALIFTFLMIGLWHGPTLPFVLMGLLQGVVITAERMAANRGWKLPDSQAGNLVRLLKVHLVINVSGILFLSPDMGVAMQLFNAAGDAFSTGGWIVVEQQLRGFYFVSLIVIASVAVWVIGRLHESPGSRIHQWVQRSAALRCGLLYLLFGFVLAFSEKTENDFLYFFF